MAEENSPDCGHFNQFEEDYCVICILGFKDENAITVTRKGILTIIEYSKKRGWLKLGTYLAECISVHVTHVRTVLVHKKCRRDFTDQKRGMEKMLKKLTSLVLKDKGQIIFHLIGKGIVCFVATLP